MSTRLAYGFRAAVQTFMADDSKQSGPTLIEKGERSAPKPIRVLLLDDRDENLVLRSAILRQNGYDVVTSASIEEAQARINDIDIAVLDYHLGAGKFGTE